MEKIRTVIVDDDPQCISYLNNILKEHDYLRIISTYTDPKEAQEAIQEIEPELVFLDIEMPGITGLDLAGEIRKVNPEISIIFITAYNQYAIQAIKKAAYDYILKPADPEELKETLSRLVQERVRDKSIINILRLKHPELTFRELEIIDLVRHGQTSEMIGALLNISRFTVSTHRQNILKKTGCINFNELLGN